MMKVIIISLSTDNKLCEPSNGMLVEGSIVQKSEKGCENQISGIYA
jgi:hypothetical protein